MKEQNEDSNKLAKECTEAFDIQKNEIQDLKYLNKKLTVENERLKK